MPPSFPYGGMENPCLTFVTPTLLAGDRSLADVVAHEIAHSWTGNLVTNHTWEHFWLNEARGSQRARAHTHTHTQRERDYLLTPILHPFCTHSTPILHPFYTHSTPICHTQAPFLPICEGDFFDESRVSLTRCLPWRPFSPIRQRPILRAIIAMCRPHPSTPHSSSRRDLAPQFHA